MSLANGVAARDGTRRSGRRISRPGDEAPECLVAKFRQHRELSLTEIEFLQRLQDDEIAYGPGSEVIVQGEPCEYLYVLKSGWAYSHKLLANGRRQVLEILLPGDLLGTREFAFHGALNSVTLASEAVLCPFPRSRLVEFYRDYPGLTAVLVDMLLREQALLVERIAGIGSRSAYQRVAHLFMELYVRLGRRGLRQGAGFGFPLNQTVVGEALGLSRVHVARTLKELRAKGLIEVSRRRATVLDEKGLIRAAEFEEFYLARL